MLAAGCSAHYRVTQTEVEHISWNEGTGKVVIPIPGADPETFVQLSEYYGKDSQSAYWQGIRIEGSAGASFVSINNYYALDERHAYFTSSMLEGSHSASFEYLGNNWSRDKNTYFYNRFRVPVCDYSTFEIIDAFVPNRAIDSICYYWGQLIVDVSDFSSLEILPENYAKDNKNAYWGPHIIAMVDVATFEVTTSRTLRMARDKNACFVGPRTLSCSELNQEAKEWCPCND